jgi:hypothetical protein
MNKENLVYIKEDNGGFTIGYTTFKPHTPYRCLIDGDRHRLVYGESVSNEEFENLFENAHERIMRHFEQIGLVVNGMPVSKKTFKELAFDVKYGNGSNSFWTVLFYTHPKELMYRFSPTYSGGSKALQMTNLYDNFIDLVNGDMENVDAFGTIDFGNCGLPLGSYTSPLKTRFVPQLSETFL